MFTQRRVLAFVAVLLLVGSLLPVRYEHWLTRGPEHLGDVLFWPISYPVHSMSAAVLAHPPEDKNTLEQLLKDRDTLNGMVVQLRAELAEARAQIQMLTQSMQPPAESSQRLGFLPAEVIGSSNDFHHPMLQINRGRSNGVGRGMIVVDGANLVGRVSDAGPLTATVDLITAPGTVIGALIVSPPVSGEARQAPAVLRAGRDAKGILKGTVFVDSIALSHRVKAGDLAYVADDAWPQEARRYVIGLVARVDPDARDPLLRQQVYVAPQGVDMRLLREVTVVRPEPDAPGRAPGSAAGSAAGATGESSERR